MLISISICSLIILAGLFLFFNAKKLATKKLPQEYPAITWKACGVFIIIIGACILIALLVFVHKVNIMISSGALTISIFAVGGIVACIKGIAINKESKKELKDVQTATENLSSAFSEDFSGSLGSINIHLKEQHPDFKKLLTYEVHENAIHTDVPKKYIYTSATVGGITTGGITEVGGYTDITKYSSHTFELRLKEVRKTPDNKGAVYTRLIKKIKLSSDLLKRAKKSKISQYIKDDCIVVIEDADISAETFNMPLNTALHTYDVQASKGYPSMKKCIDIIEWMSGN